jgi:hypothetical protein
VIRMERSTFLFRVWGLVERYVTWTMTATVSGFKLFTVKRILIG